MASFGFPFSFSQSPNPPHTHSSSFTFSAAATVAAAALAAGVGLAVAHKRHDPILPQAPLGRPHFWASLSVADPGTVSEPKTGVSFPAFLEDGRRLLGTGVRRKSIMGLKNIDVYAFGVYADDIMIKKLLAEKYGKLSVSELKDHTDLSKDVVDQDLGMTVRLQIVYGRLSIRSVRSAFEESIGSRLKKFGGPNNDELLQRFTSQFKDEYKLPRGSVIDLSREEDHTVRTTINGTEAGAIQSKLLGQSILDLYIGDHPFDTRTKKEVELQLAALLQS